jgi:hypothetical protein
MPAVYRSGGTAAFKPGDRLKITCPDFMRFKKTYWQEGDICHTIHKLGISAQLITEQPVKRVVMVLILENL